MIKIGVLSRECNTDLENNYYCDAILGFGGNPIMITKENLADLDQCKGLLLTGANEKEELDDIFIDYALKHHLALLGICQGMQSMAVFNSNFNIVSIGNNSHQQDEKVLHAVELIDSNLKSIVGKDKIMVNTHHIQTITGSSFFQIVGYSEDGLIEAIENPNHDFQIGVQWHPERMLSYDVLSCKLFQKFIDVAHQL